MAALWRIHLLAAVSLAASAFWVAGCAESSVTSGVSEQHAEWGARGHASRHTSVATIDGRRVTYTSQSQTGSVGLRQVNRDAATFTVGEFSFTIDTAQVTWGEGQALALPDGWKRVKFTDEGTRIVVQVDGKTLGEIRPAA